MNIKGIRSRIQIAASKLGLASIPTSVYMSAISCSAIYRGKFACYTICCFIACEYRMTRHEYKIDAAILTYVQTLLLSTNTTSQNLLLIESIRTQIWLTHSVQLSRSPKSRYMPQKKQTRFLDHSSATVSCESPHAFRRLRIIDQFIIVFQSLSIFISENTFLSFLEPGSFCHKNSRKFPDTYVEL